MLSISLKKNESETVQHNFKLNPFTELVSLSFSARTKLHDLLSQWHKPSRNFHTKIYCTT